MVIRLDFNDADDYQNSYDVKRIMKIALDHGIILSAHEAASAWGEHSDHYAAGWLFLPEEDGAVWSDLPAWARGENLNLR